MLTLKKYLELNNSNSVEVCVKEPNECFKFKTVLKDGVPNMHIGDEDLGREVYKIGITYNVKLESSILYVHCW